MLWLISENVLLTLVKIILCPILVIETIVTPFVAIILDVLEMFKINIVFPKRLEQCANKCYTEVFGDKIVRSRIKRIPKVTYYMWKAFITEWIT